MSTDDEKDPPVPADVEGKIPKRVHDAPDPDVPANDDGQDGS
ncbi:hypothetical protein ACIPWF_09915 [Paenarthrobacter sp. NPDC089989]